MDKFVKGGTVLSKRTGKAYVILETYESGRAKAALWYKSEVVKLSNPRDFSKVELKTDSVTPSWVSFSEMVEGEAYIGMGPGHSEVHLYTKQTTTHSPRLFFFSETNAANLLSVKSLEFIDSMLFCLKPVFFEIWDKYLLSDGTFDMSHPFDQAKANALVAFGKLKGATK